MASEGAELRNPIGNVLLVGLLLRLLPQIVQRGVEGFEAERLESEWVGHGNLQSGLMRYDAVRIGRFRGMSGYGGRKPRGS